MDEVMVFDATSSSSTMNSSFSGATSFSPLSSSSSSLPSSSSISVLGDQLREDKKAELRLLLDVLEPNVLLQRLYGNYMSIKEDIAKNMSLFIAQRGTKACMFPLCLTVLITESPCRRHQND